MTFRPHCPSTSGVPDTRTAADPTYPVGRTGRVDGYCASEAIGPGHGGLQDCFGQCLGAPCGHLLIVGVRNHLGERLAGRITHQKHRIPLLSFFGHQRGGAVPGIENLSAIARQERFVQRCSVALVEFSATLGEPQEVQHHHRPPGVLGEVAFEVGTARINSHTGSLAHSVVRATHAFIGDVDRTVTRPLWRADASGFTDGGHGYGRDMKASHAAGSDAASSDRDDQHSADEVGSSGPTRIVVRPVGTPLPLGFLGLCVATFAFAGLQLGWVPAQQGSLIAWAVLGVTVPAQLLAAVVGFMARDPVAGTGMGVLSGTWTAVGLMTLHLPPGVDSDALGVVLLASAAALLVPAVAALDKPVAAAVMMLSAVRFTVTALAYLTGSHAWQTVAGWVGLLLAVVSLYAALAFELEGVHHRAVLPLARRVNAARALSGRACEQFGDLSQEPGVSRQL